jgi:hypothetical protein
MAWTLPSTAITLRAPVRLSVFVPALDSRAEHMPPTATRDGGLAASIGTISGENILKAKGYRDF